MSLFKFFSPNPFPVKLINSNAILTIRFYQRLIFNIQLCHFKFTVLFRNNTKSLSGCNPNRTIAHAFEIKNVGHWEGLFYFVFYRGKLFLFNIKYKQTVVIVILKNAIHIILG